MTFLTFIGVWMNSILLFNSTLFIKQRADCTIALLRIKSKSRFKQLIKFTDKKKLVGYQTLLFFYDFFKDGPKIIKNIKICISSNFTKILKNSKISSVKNKSHFG